MTREKNVKDEDEIKRSQDNVLIPDLSDRPHDTRVVRVMRAQPDAIYKSFTTGWEGWFALPGSLLTNPVPQGQLFFVVEFEGRRHPHYGRFLVVEPNQRIELTWLTGISGTQGAETVLSVKIEPRDSGCELTLSHQGFYAQERADDHGKSWERILANLDLRLTGQTV
jgi:uncharacterized protein YndB with AHSA1/START domain